MRRHLLLLLVLAAAAAGCAPARGRSARAGAPAAVDPGPILALLREKTAAVRSFHATGTFYVRTEREKHFLHFEGWFERPDRSRLSVELPAFPGFGSGRLTFVRTGGEIECRVREGGEEERGVPADSALAFLAAYGLSPSTATYLLAPYAGPEEALRREAVVACAGFGDGGTRIVLGAGERGREVLDLGPDGDIGERRVIGPGGEVLLVCSYDYGEAGALFAREVEAFLPVEGARLTTRFRELEANVPLPPSVFQPAGR